MLFLLFQIGPDRYALAARETLEVTNPRFELTEAL